MKVVTGFFFGAVLAFGLASCGTKEREGDELIGGKARNLDLQSTDKYDWRNKVELDSDGTILGGKRSIYDDASSINYRKNFKTPEYLKKDFATKKWQGLKDYSAGSFQGNRTAREGGERARWSNSAARQSTLRARADGEMYATERFRTSAAREGRFAPITRKADAQTAYRQKVWGEKVEVYSPAAYRKMTVAETRGLLGR